LSASVVEVDVAGKSFDKAIREFEVCLIAVVMASHQYRKGRSAQALGISLDTLNRKIAGAPERLRVRLCERPEAEAVIE
jgi:transcriptional regulator with PAS, ATPase and Fis domain